MPPRRRARSAAGDPARPSRGRRRWCGRRSSRPSPSPATAISTAWNGASSTVMPTRSTGRHEHVALRVLAQDRGEQLDQRRPADRRAVVEPGAVGGDAHVDLAAKGRVPALDRRQPLPARAVAERRAQALERARVRRHARGCSRIVRHRDLERSAWSRKGNANPPRALPRGIESAAARR